MKPIVLVLLVFTGCGSFEPVDMPGEGSLAGCLTGPSREPAARVPVFVVLDGVAVRETATDANGCFSFEALASGRYLLVANDLRGLGLVEPVRLYAAQRQTLSPRTLAAMTLNPTLPGLRGVLSGERLGPVGIHDRLSCQSGGATLSSVTTNRLQTIDAFTGSTTSSSPVVLAQLRTPPAERVRLGSYFDEVTVLTWRDTNQPVTLPIDGGMWRYVEVTGQAFRAEPIIEEADGRWRYAGQNVFGAAGQVWVTPRCQLVASECIRTELTGRAATLTRWSAQGMQVDTLTLALDETVPWSRVSDDGAAWHLLVESPAGVTLWRVDRGRPPVALRTLPGLRVKPTDLGSAADAIVARAPSSFLRSFRLEDRASGQLWWGRLDSDDAVALVPFPQWPAGARPFPDEGSALLVPALQWVERVPSAWRVTVIEHLGASTKRRTVVLQDRDQPDYSNAEFEDAEYFPGFAVVESVGGLAVISTSRGPAVMETGAPFETARPFSTLGLGVRPVCVVGNSLFAVGAAVSDLRQQAWRYDIRRIADELARAP